MWKRLLLLASVSVVGCGYSTSSLLPSHLRTVAVRPVDNATTQPGIEVAVSDSLVAAFTSDRTMRLVAEQSAHLVVAATVTSYSLDAAAYSADQSVSRYELMLSVSVDALDNVRDESFFSRLVSMSVTFNPDSLAAGTTAEETAARTAAGRVSREIVRLILTAW